MRGRTADLQRLFHMVKWCRKLKFIVDEVKTYENFTAKENYRLLDVSAFYIGQLGELARTMSPEMKAELPEIPWRQINGMRNILIHNYYDCNPEIVWEVITKHAPAVAERCLEVLRAENPDVDAEIKAELAEETGADLEAN